MKVVAILLSGGNGTRMNKKTAKQSLKINDEKIFKITAKRFNSFSFIDEIIFVGRKEDLNEYKSELNGLKKISAIIQGGKNRFESSFNAIKFLEKNPPDIVLIHDVVRPFPKKSAVKKSIEIAKISGASILAINSIDSLVKVENGVVVDMPNRDEIFLVQTPQTFKYDVIKSAQENFLKQKFITTDDSRLVFNLGIPIIVVNGNPENIKITHSKDLETAKQIYENLLFEEI